MNLGLTGRNVLVTAATRGIGRAIAERFVREGANVAFCARGESGVKTAIAELTELAEYAEHSEHPEVWTRGAKVIGAAVDVADAGAYRAWITESGEELGGIDVFVHNASAGPGAGDQGWRASLEVDMLGLVRGVEAAQPGLAASELGSVVSIGTTAAVEAFGFGPNPYNAIKAAGINFTSQLAQQLGPLGIRVNSVSPGPTFVEGGSWDVIKQNLTPMYDQTVDKIPLGRLGTADEVANVVVFLASPAASYVTGTNVVVDGGFTKRVGF